MANVTPLRPDIDQRLRRWEPASFDTAKPAKPAAPNETQSAEAGSEPPAFKLPTADDVERIHNEAFESGQKAGFAAGYEEGTARVRMEAMQLNNLLGQLDSELGKFDQQVGEALTALALEIARQVVRRELKTQTDSIVDVVREALAQLPHQHAVLYLHPEDALLVRSHLAEAIQHGAHRIREDASVTRGGGRIEAAGTQIDATVETRWRRTLEALGIHDDLTPLVTPAERT